MLTKLETRAKTIRRAIVLAEMLVMILAMQAITQPHRMTERQTYDIVLRYSGFYLEKAWSDDGVQLFNSLPACTRGLQIQTEWNDESGLLFYQDMNQGLRFSFATADSVEIVENNTGGVVIEYGSTRLTLYPYCDHGSTDGG